MNESEVKDKTSEISEEVTTKTSSEKGTFTWIIGALVIAVVLILIALYFTNLLPGVSSDAVATVNGIDISEEQLNEQILRSQGYLNQMGSTLDEDELSKQLLDGLINQTLLVAAAEDAGITVTEEEVDAYIETIKSQFESEDAFETQLQNNNATLEDLRETVYQQRAIEAYIISIVGEDQVVPTDEEIEAQYAQIQELAGPDQELPPLEEIQDIIAQEVRLQKLEEAQLGILTELKEDAEIEINL